MSRNETIPIAEADGCFDVKRPLTPVKLCKADRETLPSLSWFLEQVQTSTR